MGRSAKIKWVLLHHLIRRGALSVSCSWFWSGESRGKGLTSLSCSSALGSMDGQRGISLIALPKLLIITWECKGQSCTKPWRCGCTVALEAGGCSKFYSSPTIPDVWFTSTAARCGNVWVRVAANTPNPCSQVAGAR